MPTRAEISDTAIKTEEIAVDRYETRLVYPRSARRDASVARLELLWENRRFLLKLSAIGLAISLVVALLIPHRFNSTVQLMPPDQQSLALSALAAFTGRSGTSSALAPLAGLAGDLLGQRTSGQLFIGVLQSRTVLTALITKFDLRKVYKKKLWIDAGKTLVRRTEIKEDKKSGIITITVSDRSPQRAAQMAQEYVNQLNFVITELNTSSARREREFLEGRLKQVNAGLEVAERNFGDFASKNAAIDIPEEGKAMLEAGAELQGELIAAQTELQGLRQIYADDHVKVRSMQARVNELQRQMQNLGGKSASSGDVANVDGDALYPTIRKLPVLGVQYADLLRTARVQEAVFEVLTQEYELAKVQEAKEVPSVKVLDTPSIAERKSFPPRRVITIVGALLFFVGAMLWIIGRDRWEQLDPNDRRKSLAVRVYGDLGEHWRCLVLRIRQARASRSAAADLPDEQHPSGLS
ncbi:MAG: GumC family protein [Candidatus Acidiferrales bacterium]